MDDQGIDSLKEIAPLKHNKITALCKIVWKLGGTNDDEGHTVSQKAEKSLKLYTYLIKHQMKCISWLCDYDTITLNNVQAMILIHEFKETWEPWTFSQVGCPRCC
jgi:hypothetical protein